MSYASDALRAFHEAFDVPMGEPSAHELAARRRTLHREESAEVNDALYALSADNIDEAERRVRLEALAEELADDLVIAYGTADLLGIDLDVAFALKMDGNMAKLPDVPCPTCHGEGGGREGDCLTCETTGVVKGKPIKRDDGKVLKPEGWQKPSMAEAIR
jgi:predicted HAD superfamily Cof-like phosphohydrolase